MWSSVCTKEESHWLETLLNFACRTVLCKRRDYSASSARKELGISTLSARRKIHLAQTVYKCISLQSPTYLSNLFPLQILTIILEHLLLLNKIFHVCVLPLARRHLVLSAHPYGDLFQTSDAVQTLRYSQDYVKITY